MTSNGFVNFGDISTSYALDTVFVKDFLRYLILTVTVELTDLAHHFYRQGFEDKNS